MSIGTPIPVDEYLRTSFHPDCDFIEGEVRERNGGKRKHSYAQGETVSWFNRRKEAQRLQALPELRMQVKPDRVRIPDVVVCEIPIPDEEVFTSPPWLCIEVMSPDDTIATIAAMQDRLDDYLQFGISHVWVIDPWKHRGRLGNRGWWDHAHCRRADLPAAGRRFVALISVRAQVTGRYSPRYRPRLQKAMPSSIYFAAEAFVW